MTTVEIIRLEKGRYNPGTPGTRAQAAVPNADNFSDWLEAEGWVRLDD